MNIYLHRYKHDSYVSLTIYSFLYSFMILIIHQFLYMYSNFFNYASDYVNVDINISSLICLLRIWLLPLYLFTNLFLSYYINAFIAVIPHIYICRYILVLINMFYLFMSYIMYRLANIFFFQIASYPSVNMCNGLPVLITFIFFVSLLMLYLFV